MAIKVSALVWKLAPAEVTSSERLVLLCLADHCPVDGSPTAWPAVATIARETSLSRRTVQPVLRSLHAKGFLVADGRGRRGTTRYTFDLARLDCAKLLTSHRATRANLLTSPHRGGAIERPRGRNLAYEGGAVAAPESVLNRCTESEEEDRVAAQPSPHPSGKTQEEKTEETTLTPEERAEFEEFKRQAYEKVKPYLDQLPPGRSRTDDRAPDVVPAEALEDAALAGRAPLPEEKST